MGLFFTRGDVNLDEPVILSAGFGVRNICRNTLAIRRPLHFVKAAARGNKPGDLAGSEFPRSAAIGVRDHEDTLARRAVMGCIDQLAPIRREGHARIRIVEQAVRSTAENRNLVHLTVCGIGHERRVIQKVSVGSESGVADEGRRVGRNNLDGAFDC